MSHVPHQLADEFPEFLDRLHILKQSDEHFGRLADEYHQVNHKIHRIESEIEPASDEHWEILKKRRLALKDAIHAILIRT